MESLIGKLIPVFQEWWEPLKILFYFIGTLFLIGGLQAVTNPLSSNRRGRHLLTIVASILLLNIPSLLDTMSLTFFNSSSEQMLSYAPPAHPGSIYVQVFVLGTMVIGLVSLARGCMYLKASNNGEPQVSRAVVHIVAGTLAVNIVQFLHVIGATFGGDVESTINIVIG